MGFHLVRKRHLAAALMVAPALATGYYASDPANLGIAVNPVLSGAGSVHGRHVPDEASEVGRPQLGTAAAHLFAVPHKGPRADRYVEFTHSTKGLDLKTKVAEAPVQADTIVTGSLPKADRQPNPAAMPVRHARDYGVTPRVPVAERTTASLFLSSLLRPYPTHFPEFAQSNGQAARQLIPANAKISRGLKFKGESETEYQARQRRCLATAIYFEARGEPTKGQLAVAQVVMNRVRSSLYPDTICGVVFQGQLRRTGCQFSFTCDGRPDVPKDMVKWRQANELAKQMTDGQSWLGDIGHSTHYHANYVAPRWRRELNKVKKVGRHIFYRVKGEQIEDVLTSERPERGLALAGSG